MEEYYVNKVAQTNGDHEVHVSTCIYLPSIENRQRLGYFSSCSEAVREAKNFYSQSNGCFRCCPACHTN